LAETEQSWKWDRRGFGYHRAQKPEKAPMV